ARKDLPKEIAAILDIPAARRSKPLALELARYFRKIAPELQPVRDELAALAKPKPAIPAVPGTVQLPPKMRRVTHLPGKGNFLDPGEKVEPGVPKALSPSSDKAPRDRLDLARWLVDPHNPLTARVTANRFWAQIFGTGLVESEEDFGTQGELPS